MAEAKKTTKKTKKEEVVEAELIVEAAPAVAEEVIETKKEKTTEPSKTAKAGKRSAKALKETEEKEAKEERKAEASEITEKPKVAAKPARSRLERRGKNFRKVAEQIEKDKLYTLAEGLELATKTNPVKFDASVELHVRLGVDPRQADQNLRAMVVLPAGTGKSVRVAVFADADDVAKAQKAGADIAGNEEFLALLDKGVIEFDTLIATPTMMAKLGKYARVLGPKGLMPNPKSGTVTKDVAKAIKEAKGGRVEYRVDSTGIVHVAIGKVSFGTEKLLENAKAVTSSIRSNKPASVKANYVQSVFIASTMGPSIKVNPSEV